MLKLEKNKDAPHVAVIKIYLEIYEQLPSGELSGNVAFKNEYLGQIKGDNLESCLNKVDASFGRREKTDEPTTNQNSAT